MEPLGKTFLWIGAVFLLLGLIFVFGSKIPFISSLGNLPGDIRIEKENFKIYFPFATSVLLSIGLSLLLYLWNRFFH
ncbi:DUF2905 domain-containing protein [Leptospira wolffii]|uniref:Uncharacterized protein n=1 Tax=Leptospira wolffii TaxID=409998 RepID=A0A2M9ZEI4_9LEPT|nr:DUF2905 domain-containing protein [Leptospira wolffii]PJZ66737.1 hypothetical protein CH371_01125 [Leptospira wolffii]TGK61713.1 DUF2905 domain-containing protein [Leptospira wolffii]TGK70256.1 DUF2905 domain-containing protein [Leptospira wolffii]TGK77179.1 DUF2905 domain-containing protein [Leptospira wolffii]TGL30968.1 DUF2905 domain-containing protein [Leptospira wolffii]